MEGLTSPFQLTCIEGMPSSGVLEGLTTLNETVFGFGETSAQLGLLFTGEQRPMLLLCVRDGQPVGFKMGFRCAPGTFESWRGGVLPDVRRQGVARLLMQRQHAWCAAAGFRFVQTAVSADNTAMLILNLQAGFGITGSYVNRAGKLKLRLEKRLEVRA